MADSPYERGRSQRIADDERRAAIESEKIRQQKEIEDRKRESEEYARSFQRNRLFSQFVQAGDPQPIALKKALDIIPTNDPKVMLAVNEAAKAALHPKEFAPIVLDGTTYNSNTITGEVGRPITPPREPLDTSRRSLIRQTILDKNKDTFGTITNSPANILNEYDAAINSPIAPVQPPETAKSPVEMANQLAKEHPDWTREKIIQEVKTRLKK